MDINYESVIRPKTSFGPYGKGGVVKGFVKSTEWTEVVDAFEENFALNLELGSQLSIYRKGENVVELCGRSSSQPNYDISTLQNIFSSGKNMEAICVAVLVDRGLLSYEDKVSQHWPEFGQHGKENITIADILRHEGGLPFFTHPEHMDDPKKDRRITNKELVDVEPMEEIIANAGVFRDKVGPKDIPLEDMKNSTRHYHSTTRGWIISGIVRRVDKKTRTLGQFMHDEVCQSMHVRSPLETNTTASTATTDDSGGLLQLDIYCGMPPALQNKFNFAKLEMINHSYLAVHEVLPGQLANALPKATAFNWLRKMVLKPTTPATQGMINTFWTKMNVVRRHSK